MKIKHNNFSSQEIRKRHHKQFLTWVRIAVNNKGEFASHKTERISAGKVDLNCFMIVECNREIARHITAVKFLCEIISKNYLVS